MEQDQSYNRYQRQIILKEFGVAGQQKLQHAKVLVIGAGGLGCPALQYLAAAGIGTIGIIDDDVIALSNLHRQVLFSSADIGLSKAEKAAASLRQLNTAINIISYNERLTVHNALELFKRFDIVMDGTDNFATRYLVNDACVLTGKPLIYGAVNQFEGQVAILNVIAKVGVLPVNYRDLFPEPPKAGEVLNCAEAGVLGTLPGIIGTMQANEIIKFITGMGKPLVNTLLTYNSLFNETYHVMLQPLEGTRALIPATEHDFLKMDYYWLCGTSANSTLEIGLEEFNELIAAGKSTIIDVREPNEAPQITSFPHLEIPFSDLLRQAPVANNDTIVVFCQSGKRSMQAAQGLFDTFGNTKKIFSLQGGILNWLQHQQTI